jgi:hypothetical protein
MVTDRSKSQSSQLGKQKNRSGCLWAASGPVLAALLYAGLLLNGIFNQLDRIYFLQGNYGQVTNGSFVGVEIGMSLTEATMKLKAAGLDPYLTFETDTFASFQKGAPPSTKVLAFRDRGWRRGDIWVHYDKSNSVKAISWSFCPFCL